MGIENQINGLVPGIKPEDVDVVIQAYRSGGISETEKEELAKRGIDLKLQEKILKYFYSEKEMQIGDKVLFNLGDDPQDPNYFMTQTAVRKYIKVSGSGCYAVYEYNENTREKSLKFYNQFSEELKDDVEDGKVVKSAEQKFAELADLDPNGKYVVENGYLIKFKEPPTDAEIIKEGLADAWNSVKNSEAVKTVEGLATLGAAGAAAGAATGATVGATGGTFVVPGLGTAAGAGGGAVGGAVIGAVSGIAMGIFTSCDGLIAQQNVNITVSMSLEDLKAELQKGNELHQKELDMIGQIILYQLANGTKLDTIINILGSDSEVLRLILNALDNGNKLLQDVRGLMEQNNETGKKILEYVIKIYEKLSEVEAGMQKILSKFPGLKSQLDAILNAIKNNQSGTTDPTAVLAMLEEVIRLLKSIDKSTSATEETTRKILAAIQKLGADQAANFAALIDAINNNYGGHGPDYTNLLNLILAKLDKIDQHNQQNFEDALNKMDEILQAIKDHHVTIDVTGTVTCNCNCGNNDGHEGIINDITGLIS